ESVGVEKAINRAVGYIVGVADLVGTRRAVARIRRIACLGHGERGSGARRVDTVHLPSAQQQIHRARRLSQEALPPPERQIIEPAQREALADMLRAQPALLAEVAPVLNRRPLAYER